MSETAKTSYYGLLTASLGVFGLGLLIGCTDTGSRRASTAFQQGDVRHGEYLSKVFCCQECHTVRQSDEIHLNRNLLLAGGVPFPGPDGSLVYSANLTITSRYSAETIDNLIRGRLAYKFVMPTSFLNEMSADDMGDLIAYLKTLNPLGPPLPDPHLPPGYVLAPPNPAVPIPPHEPPMGTVARGEYLSRLFLCGNCHTPDSPGLPPQRHHVEGGSSPVPGTSIFAPNLTPDLETGLGAWSDVEIKRAIRSGLARDGRALDSFMPSLVAYHDMTDRDASDLVLYLRSLKPIKVSTQFAAH